MSETMNEEKLIMDRFGNENPFRVPENYFNEFPQRIMKRIERQKERSRRRDRQGRSIIHHIVKGDYHQWTSMYAASAVMSMTPQ